MKILCGCLFTYKGPEPFAIAKARATKDLLRTFGRAKATVYSPLLLGVLNKGALFCWGTHLQSYRSQLTNESSLKSLKKPKPKRIGGKAKAGGF